MSRRSKFIAAAVVLVAAALGAAAWYLIRDNPDQASLAGALAGRSTTTTINAGGGSTTTTASSGDTEPDDTEAATIEGTWTMRSGGGFDFSSSTGTFAGFRIKEELGGIGATEAVGRTGDVTGSMSISGSEVTAADFTVDLTTIRSNDSRRASRIQEALDTARFPTATFKLTKPIELPDGAAAGKAVKVTATGALTIHGVTRSVRFPLQAQLDGNAVAVAGSLDVSFADYDVEVPKSRVVLAVEDHGPIELQLLLTRA